MILPIFRPGCRCDASTVCGPDSEVRPDCGLHCSAVNRGAARVNEAESSRTSAQGVQSQAISTALSHVLPARVNTNLCFMWTGPDSDQNVSVCLCVWTIAGQNCCSHVANILRDSERERERDSERERLTELKLWPKCLYRRLKSWNYTSESNDLCFPSSE